MRFLIPDLKAPAVIGVRSNHQNHAMALKTDVRMMREAEYPGSRKKTGNYVFPF